MCFEDEIRGETFESIKACKLAGVAVKMVTGDHSLTAISVALKSGILVDQEVVVEGFEIEGLDDHQLRQVALQTSVFSRADPEHKFKIVQALQKMGQVVMVTGDGVNDGK
jgi:Ca2+-transporting ATPase